MSLTFANRFICGKSVRIVRSPTHDEYVGQKSFDIRSQMWEEICLVQGCPPTHTRILYITQTVAWWRHRLYMQTNNKGTCSNLVAYWTVVFCSFSEGFLASGVAVKVCTAAPQCLPCVFLHFWHFLRDVQMPVEKGTGVRILFSWKPVWLQVCLKC